MTDKFELIAEYREEYRRHFLDCIKEGLDAIRKISEGKKYIGKHFDYPCISYRANGLPDISKAYDGQPTDYSKRFSGVGGPEIDEDKLSTFNDLVSFVKSAEILHEKFKFSNEIEVTKTIVKFDSSIIKGYIKSSLDRYIHRYNTFEYDESKAGEIVDLTVAYLFEPSLSIDIYVPILFVDFKFDEFQISPNVRVVRLNQEQHLARYMVDSYNMSAHKVVTSSATHALVLKNWSVPNVYNVWDFDTLSKPRAYPLDVVNKFFGALRISTSVDTGFTQIYSTANGWARSAVADLPYVSGAAIRSYPDWFENHHWNIVKVPEISSDLMDQVSEIYKQIADATENSIDLSLKRLNRCVTRDAEEDSVLDATIALEALLSDDGTQEMTHKLALRVGAISKLDSSFKKSPIEAFKDIKSVYAYRSAIVHGSKNLEKKRVIKLTDSTHVTAHSLAVDYLRMVLRVLLQNPKYRNPLLIDQELLLGGVTD